MTKSLTNWKKLRQMKDEDIDYSDAPEINQEFLKKAVRAPSLNEQWKSLVEPNLLAWFKKHEKNYREKINTVLRRYVSHATS